MTMIATSQHLLWRKSPHALEKVVRNLLEIVPAILKEIEIESD